MEKNKKMTRLAQMSCKPCFHGLYSYQYRPISYELNIILARWRAFVNPKVENNTIKPKKFIFQNEFLSRHRTRTKKENHFYFIRGQTSGQTERRLDYASQG